MKPYYETDLGRLYHGDCLDILPHLDLADAIVTDPPYGLSFMGRAWDHGVPGREFWEAVQAKPGAFMLSFGGTRTVHRLTCAIEDAGWEIRDCMMWLYGSGFPKSLDVSKAIDKAAGAEREIVGYESNRARPNCVGKVMGDVEDDRSDNGATITAPATPASREWTGWGTALKPAYEPIVVARRPIEGTVAANVLKYGTGGINVDGCRVDGTVTTNPLEGLSNQVDPPKSVVSTCRFPANVIHDGSDEVLAGFPHSTSGAMKKPYLYTNTGHSLGTPTGSTKQIHGRNEGSAARFFYTAKASRRDRGKHNTHPTVKPFKLIRYLTRLVSRRGALVLDPFAGSCTLAVVCESLRRRWICIELEEAHCEIGAKRILAERKQPSLFELEQPKSPPPREGTKR